MGVILTNEMIDGAIKAQEVYGVPASVTLGQIMLESGGNNKGGLSTLAYKYNNLFGVKAGIGWTGGTATMNTKEYKNGQMVNTSAKFRAYSNVADSINDHARLLNSNTYTSKTNGATSLEDYIAKMGAVYATDPQYANKLLNIIKTNNLTRYDNGKLPQGETYNAPDSSTGDPEKIKIMGVDVTEIVANVARTIVIIFLIGIGVIFFVNAFDAKIPSVKGGAHNE